MRKDIFGFTPQEWEKINKIKQERWAEINGPDKLKPTLSHDGHLFHITYADGTDIPDHKTPAKWGWQLIGLGFLRLEDVPVAMCWRLHGEPCQKRSQSHGGPGYGKKK